MIDGTRTVPRLAINTVTDIEHRRMPVYRRVLHAPTRAKYGSDYLDDEIVVQVLDLHRVVRERLNLGVASDPTKLLRDPVVVKNFIASTWDATTYRLSTESHTGTDSMELVGLLTQLRRLEKVVDGFTASLASRARRRTAQAIVGLARCNSTDELVHSVPSAIGLLGFDRAVFSLVTGDSWTPLSFHSRIDPSAAEGLLDRLRDDAYRLPKSAREVRSAQVSSDTMRRHTDPHEGYVLWQQSRSKSFWVVPILERAKVVALVHADCYFQDRLPSKIEVGALHALCEQLGHALSSRRALDRWAEAFSSGPSEFVSRRSVSQAIERRSNRTDSTILTPNADMDEADGVVSRTAADTQLSHRELDVVRLMAEGLTNGQIGRRLMITEGTVKSHVKRILRKTGSANRAEAVAIWMNTGHKTAV